MRKPRPEPERTCVGCRERGGKRALVRAVRGPDGSISVDPTGKAPGRGAYVHDDPSCRQAALKRGSLARALRTTISPVEAGNLLARLEGART